MTPDPSTTDRGWFDAAGPAGGSPVVLVHGSEITRRMWIPQVEQLASDFRLLVPDLPGHGALADEPFTMDAAVERLSTLIETEANGRAVVVGLSLGGYVAMALAARYPEKAAGLVLASCTGMPRGPLTLPFRLYSRLVRGGGPRWLAGVHALGMRLQLPRPLAEAVLAGGLYPGVMPDVVRELCGRDVLTGLARYLGPVLFVNGKWDFLFRRHESAFVASHPRASLQAIPHAAHLVNLQQPQAFNDAVRRFVWSVEW